MFSEEESRNYRISKPTPQCRNLTFKKNTPLWKKTAHHPQHSPQQILKNNVKYEFSKIGKTLGMQVKRCILLYKNTIFYFQTPEDKNFVGYCDLDEIYCQFVFTEDKKYVLGLTNGHQHSVFFFDNSEFYSKWNDSPPKLVFQLNYFSKYTILHFIGEGSFASVYKVQNRSSGKVYAAKVIFKQDKKGNSTNAFVLQERNIILKLEHCQEVYRIHEMFEQEDKYVMILDFLTGVQLSWIIQKKQNQICKNSVRSILKNLLTGICKFHKSGIIHRDLKIQNVMVDQNTHTVKIIDFGLSLHLPSAKEKDYRKCGTMGYMAPEVIENVQNTKRPYDQKCDVFSFGIIAYMLVAGYNPVKGKSYNETHKKNQECLIEFEKDEKRIVKKFGVSCFELLKKVLEKNPSNRISATEALKLEFFNGQSLTRSHSQEQPMKELVDGSCLLNESVCNTQASKRECLQKKTMTFH